MKPRNCLFEDITAYHNIRLAFLKAIRGKRSSSAVTLFCQNIDRNLKTIQDRLSAGTIHWGPYRRFTITDPKKRVISAAPLEDRIMHHAIMNILEPLFERQMIYHTYACRKNRGTHAAVRYAFSKSKGFPWFLKLDIRKYFDSIDHAVVKRLIVRIIKDKQTLDVLSGILDSYETAPGRGLPIGNLTSQFFANLYLSPLDHYILEQLKPRAYVRYMDDVVLWGPSKGSVRDLLPPIREYTADQLCLRIKEPVMGATEQGLPFLGFLIKKKGIYLLRKSKARMIKRVGEIKKGLAHSSEEAVSRRIASVYAAVQLARSRSFRVRLWYGNGLANDVCGHEPGDPGAPPRTGERVLVGTTMRPTARLPTGTTTVLITGTIILGSGWPAPESRESVSLCVTKRRCGTKPFPAVCARGREKRVMPLCWYRGRGPAGKV